MRSQPMIVFTAIATILTFFFYINRPSGHLPIDKKTRRRFTQVYASKKFYKDRNHNVFSKYQPNNTHRKNRSFQKAVDELKKFYKDRNLNVFNKYQPNHTHRKNRSFNKAVDELKKFYQDSRNKLSEQNIQVTDDPTACKGKIPPLLHQVYANSRVPVTYRSFIEECQTYNNDLAYVLWTDEDAKLFMRDKFPQYYKLFTSYGVALQQSDAIRLFVLLYYGGVYMDMDVECLKPLRKLLLSESCFFDQERNEQTLILWDKQFLVMNSVMGCNKGHSFFTYLTQNINASKDKYKDDIVMTTGPIFLTEAYKKYNAKGQKEKFTLLSPEYFSPFINEDKRMRETVCSGVFSKKLEESEELLTGAKNKGCHELQRLGKDWQLKYLTNNTYGVHHFYNLGYSSKRSRTMDHFQLKTNSKRTIYRYSRDADALEMISRRCFTKIRV